MQLPTAWYLARCAVGVSPSPRKGTRGTGETIVIAGNTPAIKLDKTSPQYATEVA